MMYSSARESFFKKKIFYWFSYKKNDESRFIFLGHSRDTRVEGSVWGGRFT